MDLKDISNKQELCKRISSMCNEYEQLLLGMANNDGTYKKAALLYYWLRDYKNYLGNESTFSPNYLPTFNRGNIVNVNFGFNLGSELGGLHFGIVLADSSRKNPNLVVAPLTSLKKDKSDIRNTEVYLGEELFFKIQGKYTALKTSIPNEIQLLKNDCLNSDNSNLPEIDKRLEDLEHKVELLEKTMRKLQTLKHGSVAVMNQIRTVSKMRVSDPTDIYDILYGIKLSSKALDMVDAKIAELYLRRSN